MGCLHLESWDGINGDAILAKYTTSSGVTDADISTSFGASGTKGINLYSESVGLTVAPSTAASGVMGIRFRVVIPTAGTVFQLFNATDGASAYVLGVGINGSMQVYVDSWITTAYATSVTALQTNTWYFLEFKWTIANSGGNVTVVLNGTDEIINYTGDTQRGTAAWDKVVLNPGASIDFDDWYLLDQSATAPNDFLGDRRVQFLTPDGDGAYTQWIRNSGSASYYTYIDDADPDTDRTDYLSSSTVGSTVTVTLSNLAAGTIDVDAVQLLAALDKSDAGSREVTGALYIGSTLYTNSSPVAPSNGTVTYGRWLYNTSPATATTWTTTEVNGLAAGVKVTT